MINYFSFNLDKRFFSNLEADKLLLLGQIESLKKELKISCNFELRLIHVIFFK